MKQVNILPVGWSKPYDMGEPRYYYHDQNLNFDECYVNILDTRPMFGRKGASKSFFDNLSEQSVGPDYIILNKMAWGIGEMNMLSLHSQTRVVYPLDDVSEIHDVTGSYYVDCVLIRKSRIIDIVEMVNRLNDRRNMKPIWIDTTNLSYCMMSGLGKLATTPVVTHCLSTVVANMSAKGMIMTDLWDADWSADYTDLIEPVVSEVIYKYNQYVMASWCEGLKPLSFDEFLKGGK